MYDRDVSQVTDMSNLLRENTVFDQQLDSWNVSHVTEFGHTFYGTNFNQSLSSWDTSQATNLQYMFHANHVIRPTLSSWDVSKVKSFKRMFSETTLANPDISAWSVPLPCLLSHSRHAHIYLIISSSSLISLSSDKLFSH